MVDSRNQLWVGTDRGVYLYDGAILSHYGTNEGLIGNEINRNALIEDAEGRIWVGTEKGASVFLGDVKQKPNLKVDLTEISTNNGSPLEIGSNTTLSYSNNDLLIGFECLSYIDENKLNYQFRLNENEPWINRSDASNDIVLSNIEAGNYHFEIQARLGEDKWGPITSFKFQIQKPYYTTWWFFLLCFIAMGIVARTIFYFRYMILIRQREKLMEVVEQRTKEISELNEKLEEKVKIRTKELEDKNKQLEAYAYINAHYLRGPLSKIMSLLHIQEMEETNQLNSKYIQILKESADELDKVIHSINETVRSKSGSN